jgi:hypothetical protein
MRKLPRSAVKGRNKVLAGMASSREQDVLRGFETYMKGVMASITSAATTPEELSRLFAPRTARSSTGRRPRRPFLVEMFVGASEVQSSLQQLESIAVYARTCPYRSKKITRVGHLRYHVEGYYQEVGLLRGRLLGYLKVVERLYARDPKAEQIKRRIERIRESVVQVFQRFIAARDSHVHEERLRDSELASLAATELIASEETKYRPYYEVEYRMTKEDKVRWMRSWNHSFRLWVSTYFSILSMFLFQEDGKLRTPPGAR